MTGRQYTALFGALLVLAGGMSPMLHIPIIGNWNYWDIDTVLALLVYVLAATALLATVLKRFGLVRFCGWAILALVLFTLVAVYFKVNNYFNFIPFKKLAAAATRLVHYRWIGWGMLFAGAVFMILSGRKPVLKDVS